MKKVVRKKLVAKKTTAKKKNNTNKSASSKKINSVSLVERERMVAVVAYYKAENRGFVSGNENLDWLEAEKEVDAILLGGKP